MCGMKFILCAMKFILLFKLFLQVQDMLMEQKEIIACALCGGVREAPEVPPQDDVGGLPPDVPLCLHGNCMCLCKTMVSKSNMMM